MSLSLSDKPLTRFLQNHLQSLATFFVETETLPHALIDALRHKLHAALYDETIDLHLRPFLLQSCEMIPHLGQDTLGQYLRAQDLPAAHFLSEPPAHFDSALVPLHHEVSGSSYVLYLTADLAPQDIYELLAHAYGHLAFGHLRQGDTHSHYDLLDDLRSAAGPVRRWDQVIQAQQHLWFQPLPQLPHALAQPEYVWTLPGFAQAFERLQKEESDDFALTLQAFAARHGHEFAQVDRDLEHDAQLFPHQKRGAAELVVRLQKLGVALLADSVGLGKTRTVATTIRLLCRDRVITRAAILAPVKLHDNWTAELHKLHLTVSTNAEVQTDVLLLNKDGFKRLDARSVRTLVQSCQLLVIEEAHQDLRNIANKFHRNIREVALDTYGLLVTATPWNNRRGDIFAMLQPFASNRKGTDRPAHLFACFAKGLVKGREEFEQDTSLFQQIYHSTTLQRTRRQLRQSGDTSVFYASRRPYLISVPYTPEQQQHFTTLLEKIEQLHLPAYNPIHFLTTSDSSENRLSGIHRFQLLKRAESSMYAFAASLQKLADQAQALSDKLSTVADNEAAIAAWLRSWYQLTEGEGQPEHEQLPAAPKMLPKKQGRIHKLIEKGQQEGCLRDLRTRLLESCLHDQQLIKAIQQDFANLFAKDPKLAMVLDTIQEHIAKGQKVLCISQAADTAYAVYRAAMADPLLVQKGIGFLTSSDKDAYAPEQINHLAASRSDILSRFAPHSWSSPEITHKLRQSKQHYPATIDILIGTDTLSVGHNLQDARVLLNLDLCWNPMQHEQRIGRLDRPRHTKDAEPLDIYYFLNLDLIEAELALRKTLEERLASTYQDTAFDDEIFPGYFNMIEQFSRLRKNQKHDVSYVAEADALLEKIAERSARPAADIAAENERESVALQRLHERVRSFPQAAASTLHQQLVNIGRIPYYDWQDAFSIIKPDTALVAEVRFQTLDQQRQNLGKPTYQHIYVSMHIEKGLPVAQPKITLNDTALAPIVMGFLAEPSRIPLRREHIAHLQVMLMQLEEYVQQALENQRSLLKRQQRYQRHYGEAGSQQGTIFTQHIEANLINMRLLV